MLQVARKYGFSLGILLLALTVVFQSKPAQSQTKSRKDQGIKFAIKKWKDVIAIAKQQHKKIFVDAYAVWCAPCKQLKESTFKDQCVAAYFNQHFINLSIDIEKGEGKMLGEKFEINAYPTLLLFDENGEIVLRSEGFVDVQELMTLFTN